MKIVIDIDDNLCTRLFDNGGNNVMDMRRACVAIRHGTPLPKGHGDLVDIKQLDRQMYHVAFETDTELQKWDSGCWIRYKLYETIRDTIPTIIEADKTESDSPNFESKEYIEERINNYNNMLKSGILDCITEKPQESEDSV